MAATIENLTDKPLWLRLNSGASLSIMPRTKREVPEGEVKGNAKLAKLHDAKVIRTAYSDPEDAKAAEAKAADAKPAARDKEAKKKEAETKAEREAAKAAGSKASEDDKEEDQ